MWTVSEASWSSVTTRTMLGLAAAAVGQARSRRARRPTIQARPPERKGRDMRRPGSEARKIPPVREEEVIGSSWSAAGERRAEGLVQRVKGGLTNGSSGTAAMIL